MSDIAVLSKQLADERLAHARTKTALVAAQRQLEEAKELLNDSRFISFEEWMARKYPDASDEDRELWQEIARANEGREA